MVNNITTLSEARYCAGMGVHYLGFSPQSIDAKTAQDITGWLSGPQYFIDVSDLPSIPDLNEYPSEYILISYHQLKELRPDLTKKIMVKVTFNEAMASAANTSAFVIADSWTQYQISQSEITNLIVRINQPESIDELLNTSIAGFMLTGGSESKPGLMEYDHLSTVLEKLEEDN